MGAFHDWEPPPPPHAEEAARLQADYHAFLIQAWDIIDPSSPLVDEWYIHALTDHLQAWARGEIKDLMIHFRPRMGKSQACSIGLGAWLYTWWPTCRILWSSYSDERRVDDSFKTRALIRSAWYQDRWSRPLTPGQDEKHRFSLVAGGQRYSAIYGSGGTGDGGERLGMDDPQCDADQRSPTELDSDETWFYSTWQRRRNDERTSGMLGVGQHLGNGGDLLSRLRANEPRRWQNLSLQTRKTSVSMAIYYKGEETLHLPLIDTALSRDGRFEDPRQPGELLSQRVDPGELAGLQAARPEVYAAQEQQAPVRGTVRGAAFSAFSRAKHVGSFCALMGATTMRQAIALARARGWHVTASFDHGAGGNREWGLVHVWHPVLNEVWTVAAYTNATTTTIEIDAEAFGVILDDLGLPRRAIEEAVGDVGNLGKGSTTPARRINDRLGELLGFDIATPWKGAGSVDDGVADINVVLGSGGIHVDEGCRALILCLENWRNGSEDYKDGADAWRYKVGQLAKAWLSAKKGAWVAQEC